MVDTASGNVVKGFNVGASIGQHLSRDGKWLFPVSAGFLNPAVFLGPYRSSGNKMPAR